MIFKNIQRAISKVNNSFRLISFDYNVYILFATHVFFFSFELFSASLLLFCGHTCGSCLDPRIHATPSERILNDIIVENWELLIECCCLLNRYFKKSCYTKIIHLNSAIGLFKIRLQESAKVNDLQII